MIYPGHRHTLINSSNRHNGWIKYVGGMFAVVILASVATLFFTRYNQFNTENIRDFLNSFGMWAPLAFGIVYIAASPIPFVATILSTTAGVLFGPIRGTLFTIVIASISALVPFTLSRQLGQAWISAKLKGKKLDLAISQASQQFGFTLLLLTRLIPVLPWELQNYVLGITYVSVWSFLGGTLVGTIPGTFSLVYLGDSLTKLRPNSLWVALGLNVATLLVPALVLLVRKFRKNNSNQISR